MPYSRIAVVTGANKGIGYAIVRRLALEYPKSSFNNGRILIYLAARSKERGEDAVRNIYNDTQLQKESALVPNGGLADVQYHALDVADSTSIDAFGNYIKSNHPDGIDIAINNAGIQIDGFDSKVVDDVLQTNYYGTLEASEMFLKHLRPGGRLVNVASLLGKIGQYSQELQAAFREAAAQATPEATSKLMHEYAQAVAAGTESQRGWPRAAYSISKAGCIAMTKALAHGEQQKNSGILINAVCPGYIKTDLTRGRGVGTPERGSRGPVMLALDDLQGKTGEFWTSGSVYDW